MDNFEILFWALKNHCHIRCARAVSKRYRFSNAMHALSLHQGTVRALGNHQDMILDCLEPERKRSFLVRPRAGARNVPSSRFRFCFCVACARRAAARLRGRSCSRSCVCARCPCPRSRVCAACPSPLRLRRPVAPGVGPPGLACGLLSPFPAASCASVAEYFASLNANLQAKYFSRSSTRLYASMRWKIILRPRSALSQNFFF